MEIKKHDYGDGSGLREWYFADTRRQVHRLCTYGNQSAIPALKALGIEVTLENVLEQIKDFNFAINTFAYGIVESFERTMNEVESGIIAERYKREAKEKICAFYKHLDSNDGVLVYGKYLTLSNEKLSVDLEAIKQNFTKHLESDKERLGWQLLCGVCDHVNALFSDKVPSNWEDLFKIQNGVLVPITPIYESDFNVTLK